MDGVAFMQRVEAQLQPIAPIMTFVIKKQMTDLNAQAETLTPDQARSFIDRMTTVLRTFAPDGRVDEIRQTMLREFRSAAPDYSERMMRGGP